MDQSEQSINIEEITKKVFLVDKVGKIFIGGKEIEPSLLEALKDQAENFKTTQLFEIILSTLKNEACELAVQQSKEWNHIEYAKALWHVQYVLENILFNLTKK